MPELPEVETIRKSLEDKLKGLVIDDVDVYMEKLIKEPTDINDFKNIIKGKKIEALSRRGKYLILNISGGYVLVMHLRMTGRLLYVADYEHITKHTHVIFYLKNK